MKVDLVHLVCLVYPLSLVQPNTRDRPERPADSLTLMVCFSILLAG